MIQGSKIINTFSFIQPVGDQPVELLLCFFSNRSFSSNEWRFTYSIVGKIKGMSCTDSDAEIIASYPHRMRLADTTPVTGDRFIYSNYSKVPVMLEINVRLKGALSWQGSVDVWFRVRLHYSLRHLVIHSIHSNHRLQGSPTAKFALMQ